MPYRTLSHHTDSGPTHSDFDHSHANAGHAVKFEIEIEAFGDFYFWYIHIPDLLMLI